MAEAGTAAVELQADQQDAVGAEIEGNPGGDRPPQPAPFAMRAEHAHHQFTGDPGEHADKKDPCQQSPPHLAEQVGATVGKMVQAGSQQVRGHHPAEKQGERADQHAKPQ